MLINFPYTNVKEVLNMNIKMKHFKHESAMYNFIGSMFLYLLCVFQIWFGELKVTNNGVTIHSEFFVAPCLYFTIYVL